MSERTPLPTSYRHHPFETRCRSCDELIVWFRTPSGKRMPVNAETTKPTDAEHQLDLTRHVSHFATCPDHRYWRK